MIRKMEVHSTQKKYAEDNYPRMPQPNEDGIKEWSMVIYYLYIKINKIIIIILKYLRIIYPPLFCRIKKSAHVNSTFYMLQFTQAFF